MTKTASKSVHPFESYDNVKIIKLFGSGVKNEDKIFALLYMNDYQIKFLKTMRMLEDFPRSKSPYKSYSTYSRDVRYPICNVVLNV